MRPLQDCQLVAQGKVFQLQCCSSSKPRSDANQCGKQSSKHQVETLAAYPDKINDLNLNEVIGRDSEYNPQVTYHQEVAEAAFKKHECAAYAAPRGSLEWAMRDGHGLN